jgi:glycosyltransferase involved in cell wall biosynthesis
MRGGEKCLEVLCRHFPDAPLFTLLHHRGSTSSTIERMQIQTSFLQHIPGEYRYLLPLMPRAIESLRIPSDTDLVISFSHAVAKGVRVPPGVPHICYCFTPMRYAWQLRQEYFGSNQGRGLIRRSVERSRNFVLDRIQQWDRRTSDRVTHFVAISQTISRRIEECYGRSSVVIYPPVDTAFYTPTDQPREDFYLVVSALVPYKRIELAIAACQKLGRRLVIVGAGPQRRRLSAMAGPGIDFLGWQSNEAIRELLRTCKALLFPTHEDLGIVPLEAQACGAPVIALARGGATETILAADAMQQGTGVFFADSTADSLAEAIQWFESHADCCCPKLAREQAERFSLPRFEREILGFIERVANDAARE